MSSAVALQAPSDYEPFPDVDPGAEPLGSRVLVMCRVPPRRIGSIELPESARDTKRDVTQVAKIVALGPLAFRNRDTGEMWTEGAWCEPGDFVRVPRYQGDRFKVKVPGRQETAEFVIFDDHNIVARLTCDPSAVADADF